MECEFLDYSYKRVISWMYWFSISIRKLTLSKFVLVEEVTGGGLPMNNIEMEPHKF